MLYHHSLSLDHVIFGEIRSDPKYADDDFKKAYTWLEDQIDFYPLFMAVGRSDDDIRMTGYPDNWRVRVASRYEEGKRVGTYRRKGEFPNLVLFSFDHVDGVFMDFDNWHIVLNSWYNDYQISDYDKRLIFKPSWPRSRWLKKAKDNPHSVQLVTSSLDLSKATRVWVRNNATKQQLQDLGFSGVDVRKATLE